MLRSYFISAIRHLSGHKLFSFLNVFCLGIGITFSMLIGVYVIHERSFNNDLENADRQYVIKSNWKQELMGFNITTLAPLAKTVKEQYPNLVENYYRFITQNMLASASNNNYLKEEVAICDTSLVSMFGFHVLYGNQYVAFQNNKSTVVTESFALKYFGERNAIGKVVHLETSQGNGGDRMDFVITAVLKDMNLNTINDFVDNKKPYQIFIPFDYAPVSAQGFASWMYTSVPSILKLKAGVYPGDLRQPFKAILNLNLPAVYKGNVEVELQKVKDFYKQLNNGKVEKMTSTMSYIGLFILLIAITNFINIVLGTSGYRVKEIGLRKVFGGMRQQLIIQHLCESFVITFISILFSLLFYELFRPVASGLLTINLDHIWQFGWKEIVFLLFLGIIVGLVSGIYPGVILSNTKISNSVKGKTDSVQGSIIIRKGLLVVQFTIVVIVFIISLNISKQIHYFLNKDLGFTKEGLLVLSSVPRYADSTNAALSKMIAFRDEVASIPNVQIGSISYEIPDGNYVDNLNLVPEGSVNNQVVSLPCLVADENYAQTYGLKLIEGRFLRHEEAGRPLDEIVLNESAIKSFGWRTAAGKKVKLAMAGIWVTVVGVVSDFNFFSLHRKIVPISIVNVSSMQRFEHISVKFKSNDITAVVKGVQEKWRAFFPDQPFEYSFMDDNLKASYASEIRLRKAVVLATIMNLVIVFLGIFGVVASTLTRRTREIAIRKILGADIGNIILIFIREYAYLIFLANLIAWPMAYMITNKWLQDYAYHIDQNWMPYLIVFAAITLSAFLLIAAQCYKVASANLEKSLRSE
jgi:ABC-type antimicrobial peptide transport system permease subunit